MEKNILVFDIETVADVAGGRLLLDLDANVSDEEVLKIMQGERLFEANTVFPKLHLHKIACISVFIALKNGDFILTTLGRDDEEENILKRFFTAIEKFQPILVSWNGSGFDLPIINYRALIKAVPSYYFFHNDYQSRFKPQHLDLMDNLANFQGRNFAKMDDISKLCGFAGKMGKDGSQVQELWDNDRKNEIFDYCETDVLNTYGIYLRFELMRGNLSFEGYQEKIQKFRNFLNRKAEKEHHLKEYLEAWKEI